MADLIKEYKVKTPDGRSFNIKVPAHVSKEEALAWAQANMPKTPQGALDQAPVVHAPGTEPGGLYDRMQQAVSRASGGLLASPKGFVGPGVLANLGSAIQQRTKPQTLSGLVTGQAGPETPQQVYERTIPAFETMFDIFGTMGLPAGRFLTRMGTGAGVPALRALLGGKDPVEEALKGGGAQGVAEILTGGLWKMKRLGSLAETARAEFAKKMAAQEGKTAHDQAMLRTLETIDKTNYEKLLGKTKEANDALKAQLTQEYQGKMSTREDLMAGTIMDSAKQDVPAWQGIPSTVAGLYTAVLGKGKDLLSDAFQAALNAAKETARGKTVDIPAADQAKLGVAIKQNPGYIPPKQEPGDLRMMVPVDAAELIEALPGFKSRAVKERAHQALSEADLGIDPKTMTEYRVGKGTIEMVDENKLFKWDPDTKTHSVDPDALAKNILSREHMDTPQNRGMGDFDTLPGLQAAKTGPVKPEMPPFVAPEPPAPRGPLGNPPPLVGPDASGAIKEFTLPGTTYSRGAATAGLLGILGGILGAKGGGGLGSAVFGSGGGSLGYGAGAMLPNKIVTKAPMSQREAVLQELLPLLLGGGIKAGVNEASATGRSPEELAAIDAEIAAKAQSDPRLQLDLGPANAEEYR